MTRRKLFITLFSSGIVAGAAKAQKQKQLDPDLGSSIDEFNSAVRALDVRVPNGMCPVCGKQAPAIKASTTPVACKPMGGYLVECEQEKIQRTSITRCEKCSAAFWQDTE